VKVTLTPLKLMGLMAVWKARSPRIPQGAGAERLNTRSPGEAAVAEIDGNADGD
jgi:hypothetical protein